MKKKQMKNHKNTEPAQSLNLTKAYKEVGGETSLSNSKAHSIAHSPKGLTKQDRFLNSFDETQKQKQKQKLIEQNIKIKTQIFQLTRQLDQIMTKEQQKKNSNIKFGMGEKQETGQLKQKKVQLKKQQVMNLQLKNKISIIKRQLQSVYSNRTLLGKQDELKHLKQELQTLQQQKNILLKIKNDQSKILKILKNQQDYQERIRQVRKELTLVKEQLKQLNQKLIQSQRALRKNHEIFIIKQSKLKQLQKKQKNRLLHSENIGTGYSITAQMVTELQNEVKSLQKQRKQNQKSWNEKINALDQQLKQKKYEEEKKLIVLKEKQKQLKLIQLKIKQCEKLIKQNLDSKTNSKQKNHTSINVSNKLIQNEEPDMRQFRYKRNIKYLNQ